MTSTMYPERVKTITITIPEELDERAAAEARRQGISKSALIRRGLGAILPDLQGERTDDPWRELAGFGAPDATAAPGEIDEIVYGR